MHAWAKDFVSSLELAEYVPCPEIDLSHATQGIAHNRPRRVILTCKSFHFPSGNFAVIPLLLFIYFTRHESVEY
jgi:hypothetical protein